METFAPVTLKQKSAVELWQMRKRVVKELKTLADNAQGRDFTADERALEERADGNLKAIDSVIEENFADMAMSRYDHLNRPRLTQRDMAAVDWVKSAITEKNPAAFTIEPEEQRAFSVSQPGLEYRSLYEQRDTLKSTATQALPVSVWPSFMVHLVEMTPVIRAGAMVITTATGEDLQYPKSTAFQAGNLIGEGASITESDPTLAVQTFKSYKYAAFWQLSKELVEDHASNIIDTLAQTAATALALSYGNHLANGNGANQPAGYASGLTVGVTGPTGTSTSFGSQSTAGQGTDLILDLYASVAEPYLLSPSVASLARNATFTMFKKYREGSTNRPMLDMAPRKPGASVDLLGQAGYVDPHAPAMGASAKSVAFGDWSRYVVRIVQGVRVERSDEFAFQNDLASFKAIIRLDGAPVDLNAMKTFQHSAT
jgi:HK97 family phage major capsid protein